MDKSALRNMFTVSPKHMQHHLATLFQSGLVPFVRSSPGRGKSAIYKAFAEEFKLVLIDVRLSMYEPTDFSGLPFPIEGRTQYLPTKLFPIQGLDEVPEGMNGFLILLDEFNHAEPEMIRASYKLILDRMVGDQQLHEDAYVALAGNSIDDNALANATGTALNSRVTHLTLGSDPDFWLNEVAAKFDYDHRVIGFIAANKDKLNDFDPEQDEHSFCSERTWEFTSRLIKGSHDVSSLSSLISGTISPGVAAEFIQFCAIYKDIITVKDVVNDPENCKLPLDSPTKWATVTYLAKEISDKNISQLCVYIQRMELQYVIIFASMVREFKGIISNPDFIKILGRIGRAG